MLNLIVSMIIMSYHAIEYVNKKAFKAIFKHVNTDL